MAGHYVTDLGGVKFMAGGDVGGFIVPNMGGNIPQDVLQGIFDSLPDLKLREDDIMLCTYQKTGTHWMYEIISMINNRSAERVKTSKMTAMIECTPGDKIDALPSPRVLNTHIAPRFLPKALRTVKPKTVLCIRNPKDTAVSYYNHIRGLKLYSYDGKFSDWLPVYLKGELEYGKYTDYLKEWETMINNGTEFPLHVVYFEDLKLNGEKELDRLLKFLEVELDDTLKKDIMEACKFEKMVDTKIPKEMLETHFNNNFNLFRKGQVGDWKNWFTVAENEMFDKIWNEEMKNSKMFDFTYADPRIK